MRRFSTYIPSFADHRRAAFSLIEMTLVLLVMSIVAGAVTIRMEGPLHSARMDEVIAQIADFDRLSRQYARRHDRPVLLVVDLSMGRLRRSGRGDDAYGQDLGEPLELPEGYAIERLLVRRRDVQTGSASIAFGRHGLSATYAIRLGGPNGRRRWLCLTGLGGQAIEMTQTDENALRDILAATAPRRNAG